MFDRDSPNRSLEAEGRTGQAQGNLEQSVATITHAVERQIPQRTSVRRALPAAPAFLPTRTTTRTQVVLMIVLGIILAIIGVVVSVPVLLYVGVVLIVLGVVLAIMGSMGHTVAGRRHYY